MMILEHILLKLETYLSSIELYYICVLYNDRYFLCATINTTTTITTTTTTMYTNSFNTNTTMI